MIKASWLKIITIVSFYTVERAGDWAYSPSMVAAVGGPGEEDGYDTLIE